MVYKGRHFSDRAYRLIEDSVHDIPQRLKQIDPGYFLVLQLYKGKFEVHHIENQGNTYCLTNPYDGLDSRLLDLVQETKIENAKKVFEAMDAANKKMEEDSKKEANDYIGEVAKDIYKYAAQDHKHAECRLDRVVSR